MEKFKNLLEEYGRLALVVHLVLWLVTFLVMICIVQFGMKDWVIDHLSNSLGEEYAQAGVVLIAYAATKLTQPIRILLLVVLVPFIKRQMDEKVST